MKHAIHLVALFLFLMSPLIRLQAEDDPASEVPQEDVVDEADDLDDLFDDPPEDIVAEPVEADHRESYEKSDTVKVTGGFKAAGLVAAGWAGWDFIPDVRQNFDGSIGLTSTAYVRFDARPAPEFRVYGNVSTAFNPLDDDDDWDDLISSIDSLTGGGTWLDPYFSELYCDYILGEFLYARLGKHTIGWGQGRLFTEGNLMSDSNVSFNVRLSIPSWSGLSFIVLTKGAISYRQLVYAGKIDFVLADTLISPALRFNFDEGVSGLLSIKKVLFKTDFLIDAIASYTDSFQSVTTVAGFFREWNDFKLYGEYRYCWNIDGSQSHDAALAAGIKKPFDMPFDLGAKVMHHFLDNSGTITLGYSQKIWPFVTLNFGIPIIYGSGSSYAVLNNPDPGNRRIALVLSLKLSGSF